MIPFMKKYQPIAPANHWLKVKIRCCDGFMFLAFFFEETRLWIFFLAGSYGFRGNLTTGCLMVPRKMGTVYIYIYICTPSSMGISKFPTNPVRPWGDWQLLVPKLRFPVWDRYPTTDCNISAMDEQPSTRQPKSSFQASGIYFSLCLGRSFGLTM